MTLDRSVAQVFGGDASTYDTSRPSYPVEAVAWVTGAVGQAPLDVVDVGAGTGKMTAVLVGLGHRLTAVEPDARMLDALGAQLPTVTTAVGSGESIPLAGHSADAIICAQAFHWMLPAVALTEFARVLRPGGIVGLIWNQRDESVGWVARMSALLADVGGSSSTAALSTVPDLSPHPSFPTAERAEFAYDQILDTTGLVALVASRSYVIALNDAERNAALARVRDFARTDPDLAGRASFPLPYITTVLRLRAR